MILLMTMESGGRTLLSYVWILQSGVSLVGTILNTISLYIFYRERHLLWSSVNAMIW